MPFTLAHPALVLPLRRSRLPLTALVAGSLVPDVPLYLPGTFFGSRDEGHSWTHTWAGLVGFCLPVALTMVLGWVYLLQDPLVDMAPDTVRDRLRQRRRRDRGYWLLAVPAVLVGALSHLGWDQFTHEGTWTTDHVAVLRQTWAGHPVTRWSMYVFSALGLAALAWSSITSLRRRHPVATPRMVPRLAPWLLPVPLGAGALAAVYELVSVGPYMGYHAIAYYMLTVGIGVAGALLVAFSIAWHLMAPLGPEPLPAE